MTAESPPEFGVVRIGYTATGYKPTVLAALRRSRAILIEATDRKIVKVLFVRWIDGDAILVPTERFAEVLVAGINDGTTGHQPSPPLAFPGIRLVRRVSANGQFVNMVRHVATSFRLNGIEIRGCSSPDQAGNRSGTPNDAGMVGWRKSVVPRLWNRVRPHGGCKPARPARMHRRPLASIQVDVLR